MLQKIRNWLKKVVNRLLPKQNITQALQVDTQLSAPMAGAIDLWARLYTGKPPWLWDARGNRDDSVQTLQLPATIAAKVAKLVTLEMQTEVSGGARARFLEAQLAPVLHSIRRYTEYACAQGGLTLKPYLTGEGIAVDLTTAEYFYPTAFNSRGEVTGAVFAERITGENRYYTKLEYHSLTGNRCQIINRAYASRDPDALGAEIALSEVEAWADIQPEAVIEGVSRPLFAYFRIPQANTIDPSSPLGVSVYARAVELIRQTDLQYSRILWEYQGAELAIDADLSALTLGADGTPRGLPARNKRLFRNLGLSAGDGADLYKVFSPAIRDASLYNGLNKQLQQIELACGLSFGTLSDPQNVDKTATEIKSSKQDMYATVCDIQKALKDALEGLLYAMDVWTTLGGLAPAGTYESRITFKDSVTADEQTDMLMDMQLVTAGLLQPWEFRVRHFDEDEATAKAMTAGQADDPPLFPGDG